MDSVFGKGNLKDEVQTDNFKETPKIMPKAMSLAVDQHLEDLDLDADNVTDPQPSSDDGAPEATGAGTPVADDGGGLGGDFVPDLYVSYVCSGHSRTVLRRLLQLPVKLTALQHYENET